MCDSDKALSPGSRRTAGQEQIVSRRAAIGAGLILPAAAFAEVEDRSRPAGGELDVRTLADRLARANAAFMRGDMKTWLHCVGPVAADFTLMQPFGGPVSHGFDTSAKHLEELSRYFRNGETVSELVQAYASGDMIVLVVIERQHGEVGGLPDQDWSLRVTQVYRRRGDQWEYVHRHADPLVRKISLESASALARG
jgi:ketosteroid isomerase-like protein